MFTQLCGLWCFVFLFSGFGSDSRFYSRCSGWGNGWFSCVVVEVFFWLDFIVFFQIFYAKSTHVRRFLLDTRPSANFLVAVFRPSSFVAVFCRLLCSLLDLQATCQMLGFYQSFSLYSVNKPSFLVVVLIWLGWFPMYVLIIFGCFLGSLLSNQNLILIFCLDSLGIP